jgi:hypothetical protein
MKSDCPSYGRRQTARPSILDVLITRAYWTAVPNSECFNVPSMAFRRKFDIVRALEPNTDLREGHKLLWKCVEKLTKLRNAAAHRDYEEKREKLYTDLAEFFYPDPVFRSARSRDMLLEELTEICTGMLVGKRNGFRDLRQGSEVKGAGQPPAVNSSQ